MKSNKYTCYPSSTFHTQFKCINKANRMYLHLPSRRKVIGIQSSIMSSLIQSKWQCNLIGYWQQGNIIQWLYEAGDITLSQYLKYKSIHIDTIYNAFLCILSVFKDQCFTNSLQVVSQIAINTSYLWLSSPQTIAANVRMLVVPVHHQYNENENENKNENKNENENKNKNKNKNENKNENKNKNENENENENIQKRYLSRRDLEGINAREQGKQMEYGRGWEQVAERIGLLMFRVWQYYHCQEHQKQQQDGSPVPIYAMNSQFELVWNQQQIRKVLSQQSNRKSSVLQQIILHLLFEVGKCDRATIQSTFTSLIQLLNGNKDTHEMEGNAHDIPQYQQSIPQQYGDQLNKMSRIKREGKQLRVSDAKKEDGHTYNGICRITYPNGDEYIGQLSNGIIQGKGSYWFKQAGIKYEGQWAHGSMHGCGSLVFLDGSRIQSAFQNGDILTQRSSCKQQIKQALIRCSM